MFKTSRVYARMLFVGDVMIIGGNHYPVTGIRLDEEGNTVLYFHNQDHPERKITLIVPTSEIFQIKHR